MKARGNEARWVGGRWRIKIQRDGQIKYFFSSTKGKRGKAEAERKADNWIENGDQKDIHFDDLCQSYLECIRVQNGTAHKSREDATIRLYLPWGHRKVSTLTLLDYQKAIDSLVEGREKPLSVRSCGHVRATIHALYIHAKKAGYKMTEPVGLTIPTGAVKGERKILQPDDLKKLFADDGFYSPIFRFAVLTGLRPSEVCGLQQNDLSGNILTVRRARNVDGEITTGKNKNAQRTLILPLAALEQITPNDTEWLFVEKSGEPLTVKAMYSAWRRTCKRLKIPAVSLYELRHTMISMCKDTLPLPLLKAVVGHSSSMDTLGTYGHEVDGEKEQAARIIGDVFAQITGSKTGSDEKEA